MGIKDEIVELLQAFDDSIFTFSYYSTFSIDDAKEITTQVFHKYAELRVKGRAVADQEAFLYRLARNLSIRAVKEKGVEMCDDDYPVEVIEGEEAFAETERAVEPPERRQKTLEASRQLVEESRTTLILKELESKEYEDIANILGIDPDDAVRSVSRARLSLGEAFGMERIDEEKAGEQCHGYLPLLSFQVDGILEQSEKDLLDLHLKKCPFCRLVLEEMEAASEEFRSLIPLRSAVGPADLMQLLSAAEMHEGAATTSVRTDEKTAVVVGETADIKPAVGGGTAQAGARARPVPDNLGTIMAAVAAICVLAVVIVLAVLKEWLVFAIVLVVGVIALFLYLYMKNEGFKEIVSLALESLMDSFNTQAKWTIRQVSEQEYNGIIASIGNVMARDGYMPQSQTPGLYTYFKQVQERPSCLIALILWFFCIIPAIIYLLRGSKIRMMTASIQFTSTAEGFSLNVKAPGGAKRRIRKVIEPYLVARTVPR